MSRQDEEALLDLDGSLFLASLQGSLPLVRALMEARACTNQGNQDGVTALMAAASSGHAEVVSLLIQNDADPALCDHNGADALTHAVDEESVGSPSQLSEQLEVASRLLAARADPNSQRRDCVRALHLAAEQGAPSLVMCLLQAFCEVDCQEESGASPLLLAVCSRNLQVIQLLLDWRADLNLPSHSGATPLAEAAVNGDCGAVQLLLSCDADIEHGQDQGATPLYLAAQEGHTGSVRLLLAQRADPNSATSDGMTPLMATASAGHTEVARLLIAAGASTTQQDEAGLTALAVAFRFRRASVARLLAGHVEQEDNAEQ